jgi:ankyrin repeat protein
MHTASKYGQIEVVRSLLDHGSDIDERDASQWTALAVASMNGKLEVAKLLIERGANVNTRGEFGWTSLHFASRNGHLDVVRLLLNHGGDLNARQRSRRTALDLTSCYGHLEIAKLLLKSGANANVRNDYGLTPKTSHSPRIPQDRRVIVAVRCSCVKRSIVEHMVLYGFRFVIYLTFDSYRIPDKILHYQ